MQTEPVSHALTQPIQHPEPVITQPLDVVILAHRLQADQHPGPHPEPTQAVMEPIGSPPRPAGVVHRVDMQHTQRLGPLARMGPVAQKRCRHR